MQTDTLPPATLERVLESLGLSRPPAADLAGLGEAYGAWCRHVPFDNVRKRIHLARAAPEPFPGDTPEEFFAAWLRFRTGGTCWSGNGALCSLLRSLGFAAQRGIGTMLAAPNLPPNHGTVLVDIDTTSYLVDATLLHVQPLPLLDGQHIHVDNSSWGVSAAQQDGRWHVLWRPLNMPDGLGFRLDQPAATAAEFSARHEATRSWGGFNFDLHARGLRDGLIRGTAKGMHVVFAASGGVVSRPLESEERKRVLIDELGMSEEIVAQLPPDVPVPPRPAG